MTSSHWSSGYGYGNRSHPVLSTYSRRVIGVTTHGQPAFKVSRPYGRNRSNRNSTTHVINHRGS